MTGRLYDRIYAVVRRIPPGRVATYGQVAALAGLAGQARLVGYALHRCGQRSLPWQRVVNARGLISPRSDAPGAEELQRAMLVKEGVRFSGAGRIDLEQFRWEARPGEVDRRRVRRRRCR